MIYLICAGILLFFCIIILIYGYVLFRMACGRPASPEEAFEDTFSSGIYAVCHDDAVAGDAWFAEQNYMIADTVSYDKLHLKGYYLPHPNARGTLLMFHGWRGSARTDFSTCNRFYYEQGFNLLLVSQRAQNSSEGKWMTFGVKERRDVSTWLNWINDAVSSDLPIVIGGISMGASTVLMAAGDCLGPNVKGIIADCGFTSPYDIISDVFQKNLPIASRFSVKLVSIYTRLIAGFSLKACSTLDTLSKSSLPILFIHGEADEFVPHEMTVKNYEVCSSEDKRFLSVPGAGHGLSFIQDHDAYVREVRSFLNDVLTNKEKTV